MITVFDFETTSAHVPSTRVVQFALLRLDENFEVIEAHSDYANPGAKISPEAIAVHGITNEKAVEYPPDSEQLASMAAFMVRHPDILAGHNSKGFDLPILERISQTSFAGRKHIDTLHMAQRLWPVGPPNHKLSELAQWLEISSGEGAHDAMADIRMVAKLIQRGCQEMGMTPEQLADWMEVPHVQKVCGFGKHKGKLWGPSSIPTSFARWCCDNWDFASPDMQATLLYHYGKKFRFKGAMTALPGDLKFLK